MPGDSGEMFHCYYPALSWRDNAGNIRYVIHIRVVEVKYFTVTAWQVEFSSVELARAGRTIDIHIFTITTRL